MTPLAAFEHGAAAPMRAAEPGEVLSPSQVRTFMECPARWAFKYRDRLPDPQTANLALGKAVHAALADVGCPLCFLDLGPAEKAPSRL